MTFVRNDRVWILKLKSLQQQAVGRSCGRLCGSLLLLISQPLQHLGNATAIRSVVLDFSARKKKKHPLQESAFVSNWLYHCQPDPGKSWETNLNISCSVGIECPQNSKQRKSMQTCFWVWAVSPQALDNLHVSLLAALLKVTIQVRGLWSIEVDNCQSFKDCLAEKNQRGWRGEVGCDGTRQCIGVGDRVKAVYGPFEKSC